MNKMIRVIVATRPEQIPTKIQGEGIVLCYWNIRGLGQACRLSLAYAGVPFTDVRIEAGTPNSDGFKRIWFEKKPELGQIIPFPNLPYLLDGEKGVVLIQSRAILRYIGRRFNLLGKDETSTDIMIDEAADFDDKITGMLYSDLQSLKQYCEDRLPKKLSQFSSQLEKNGYSFITGQDVSVVDFKLYDTLNKLQLAEQDEAVGTNGVESNPKIMEYIKRVESLPGMASYLASPEFLDRPLNNPHAAFK